MALSVGTPAPDFSLPSTSGDTFSLSQAKGQPLVLYFYPKDFTAGCTAQACSFRDAFDVFRPYNIKLLGISTDTLETHHKFKKKYKLPFELLSDSSGKVSRKYEAKYPLFGISRRITYMLDAEHRVAAVYENMFGATRHVQEMVKELQKG